MSVVSQPRMETKQKIVVYGQPYILKKDATDAATFFPHNRVTVEEYGCTQVNKDLFMAWITGIIPATPGTLEKSLRVFYVGWSPIKIIKPTDRDILNMHVYATETGPFAAEFAQKFLERVEDASVESRPAVTPFPVEVVDVVTPVEEVPTT